MLGHCIVPTQNFRVGNRSNPYVGTTLVSNLGYIGWDELMSQCWYIVMSRPRNFGLETYKGPYVGTTLVPNLNDSGWDGLMFQCWDILTVPTKRLCVWNR